MSGDHPRILVVSPIPLLPVVGGGPQRVVQYIEYFRSAGFQVHLAIFDDGHLQVPDLEALVDELHIYTPAGTTSRNAEARRDAGWAKRLWRQLPVQLRENFRRSFRQRRYLPHAQRPSYLDQRRLPAFDTFVGVVAHQTQPRAVIASYAWTARAFDAIPDEALSIIDTIDIQHLRAQGGSDAGYDLSRINVSRDEESRELARAQVLLAIQSEERDVLQSMCPDARVLLIEHGVPIPERRQTPADAQEILFVGSLYEPNIEGIKRFIGTAWPAVREQHPDCVLTICGRVCEALNETPPGVVLEGIVPKLDPYYRRATLVVNPVPFGSGLKIKTVEALAFAKCLITTESGVAGLPARDEEPYCLVCELDEMAAATLELLEDAFRRSAFEEAAYQLAWDRFSPETVYAPLEALIRETPAY